MELDADHSRIIPRAAALPDLRCDRRQGISGVAPGIVAAQQRQGFESALAKKKRHTGAGGFVQSGTVNDRWPVRRQLAISLVDQVSGDENPFARALGIWYE